MTAEIIKFSLDIGFLACGISEVRELAEEREGLSFFLDHQYHGKMQYLENHFEKRLNPQLLAENSKSVISLIYNYYNPEKQKNKDAPIISVYAYGRDYHVVIREKLNQILHFIKTLDNTTEGRVFVDSAPILERAWAKNAGLGWIGKNGLLINRNLGSYFFISEIIINRTLVYNHKKAQSYCGECTRCIKACPTGAIIAPGRLDARKCISYLTIELKDEIPREFRKKMQNRLFGCDICQEVCPFNKKAKMHNEPAFMPSDKWFGMSKKDWYQLDKKEFEKLFKHTTLQRTKFEGIKRNLDFLDEDKTS